MHLRLLREVQVVDLALLLGHKPECTHLGDRAGDEHASHGQSLPALPKSIPRLRVAGGLAAASSSAAYLR